MKIQSEQNERFLKGLQIIITFGKPCVKLKKAPWNFNMNKIMTDGRGNLEENSNLSISFNVDSAIFRRPNLLFRDV